MKKLLLFGLLLAGFGLASCEFNQLSEDEQVDQLMLVPKQQTTGQKAKATSNQQTTPYSCLISTLADDEAEYNYWNQAFWVHFPKPAVEQAKGKTIFKAFSFASEHAGDKAGSWAGKDKIVRVAQCEIPDSKLAETLLEEQLKKFGKGTWLESHRVNQERSSQNEAQAKTTSDWEWVCSEYFITVVCQVDPQTEELVNCIITGIRCISYTLEYNGPGGGGDGFPGDDPGECDPQGTEPCYDDGGGGSIPPPEPDPCEEDNPPTYCENPCDTDNSTLDDVQTQLAMENFWQESFGTDNNPLPPEQRDEKIIFITEVGNDMEFIDVDPTSVSSCHLSASVSIPSNAVGLLHTHPYAPGDTITDQRCLDYIGWNASGYPVYNAGNVSGADEGLVSATGLPMYVMDKENIRVILPSQPNQYENTFDRCGY